ncbi:nuclear transport factor 2 family protein [Oceanirhabdus seepicola]|uniref:Nuclear transport factor 2 family protein n=1 Tax=Oceanirhabdus seepicola TaxID=2828781 RepID=A0A9J6NXI6_9CLOT|nr:nuclear transport factor 2 family protein [Oceanirhabdus seepicola]MCM1989170.1 nuclear transport factor 2 family protein [Oceanirhabdus seepicola]
MTRKILVKPEDIIDIKDVLRRFQEGYTNRNVDNLDNYMNDLFINDDRIITVGTSRSEWCFGLNELRELLESDWKFWGDIVVDSENSKINSKDSTAWFLADCTLTWDTPEDFDEWCEDLVADYFEKEGRYINYKLMSKLAMMNLKLACLIDSSHGKKGLNVPLPVRLSGGLIKKNDKWFINKLHFSTPMSSYPEWRIDRDNVDSLKYYNEVKERMIKFNKKYSGESRETIIELLNGLQIKYLCKTANVKDTIKNMFLSYDDIYVVDPNENPAAIGSENIEKMILQQREKWDEMKLNINESIISIEGDTASIVSCGLLKKASTSDELLSKEWNNIKETLQKEGKGTDKLLEVQKQIAYAFKELSFGEESLWEFRFEALAVKEENKWKFHNIQFSYPSLYVLDGNYNMTPLL